MADVSKLLGSFLGSGFAGGMAGGLATSMLTTKSGRKMGKKALKAGGVAAVGALAYTAYKRYSNNKSQDDQGQNVATPQDPAMLPNHQTTGIAHIPVDSASTPVGAVNQPVNVEPLSASPAIAVLPAPIGSAFMPEENDQSGNSALELTLVRAMIAVARADGRLDAQESQAIFQKIESLGLDSETQALLVREMGQPVDMDAIVNSANSPEVAAEIYVASLLAVDVDTPAEKAYLSMLAARLQLPSELVAELDSQVAAQKEFV